MAPRVLPSKRYFLDRGATINDGGSATTSVRLVFSCLLTRERPKDLLRGQIPFERYSEWWKRRGMCAVNDGPGGWRLG